MYVRVCVCVSVCVCGGKIYAKYVSFYTTNIGDREHSIKIRAFILLLCMAQCALETDEERTRATF